MTAAGLGLNKYCYAGLITAFKNKTPASEDTMAKVCYAFKKIYYGVVSNMTVLIFFFALLFYQILEFVQQSKGWQYVERIANDSAENIMMNVSEEELYNLPTAEYAHRRGFVFKQLTIYHVAVHACADLQSKEVCYVMLHLHCLLYCPELTVDMTIIVLSFIS
jgi:hypothetical protein